MPTNNPKNALKKSINNTINELSKKITLLDDELIQADIYQQIGSLLSQRALLQRKALTKSSGPLDKTIASLDDLTKQAKEAKNDIDKIEKILLKTSKTVDKVAQFIGSLVKIV